MGEEGPEQAVGFGGQTGEKGDGTEEEAFCPPPELAVGGKGGGVEVEDGEEGQGGGISLDCLLRGGGVESLVGHGWDGG